MVPVVFYDPTKPALTVEPRNSYLLKCQGYIWDILYLIVSSLMENRRSILTPPHCECFVYGVQPLNSRPHHFVSVLDRIDADLQQTALNYSMNRVLLSFRLCVLKANCLSYRSGFCGLISFDDFDIRSGEC